jgi:hypothetical protein
MAKNTRTPITRGQNRAATGRAKSRLGNALYIIQRDELRDQAVQLGKESARIKRSGARMGRAQSAAKAKQKGK